MAGKNRGSCLPPTARERVIVVVPAHDEEEDLPAALAAIAGQTRAPDRVIVMADRCSDRTEEIAEASETCELWRTAQNRDKKAGALNQAWERLNPGLSAGDYLLVVDADTELFPDFIANALRKFHSQQGDQQLGGVCATFYGKEGGGLLGLLQRLEYARFARSIGRKRGRTFVLSGTATMFNVGTLRDLAGERGFLYETDSMLEDYELSLAMRMRGYKTVAPRDVRVTTDVMKSVPQLWKQRIRWQRGTLEELRRYGCNRVTLPDVGRQLLLVGSVVSRFLLVTIVAASLLLLGGLSVNWGWVALAGIIAVERAISVWRLGPGYIAFALLLIPEELYGLFRETFFVRSAWLAYRGRDWEWHAT